MSAKILVLDAVATNRIVITSRLSASHYTVIACDGIGWEDIVARADHHAPDLPDLIILDVNADAGRGLDLCERFKATASMAGIPILMTYDRDIPCNAADCFAAGADDVLTRPFNQQIMLARIRNMIRANTRLEAIETEDVDTTAETDAMIPARCAVVSPDPAQARSLHKMLTQHFDEDIALIGWADVFAIEDPADAFDLLLIQGSTRDAQPLLNKIGDLRSAAVWRNAAIVFQVEAGDDSSSLIADALNTGADDAISADISDGEVRARLRRQLDLKQRQDRMRLRVRSGLRLATTDPLTGLRNRRHASRRLAEIAQQADLLGTGFTVLMLDVDHFKAVNDMYGHAVGDAVLRQIAVTLEQNLRDTDLLARVGGEEFLVALPTAHPEIATSTAERLRARVEALRFAASGEAGEISVTLSIGMVVTTDGRAVEQILDEADQALYAAKADGRNQVNIRGLAA